MKYLYVLAVVTIFLGGSYLVQGESNTNEPVQTATQNQLQEATTSPETVSETTPTETPPSETPKEPEIKKQVRNYCTASLSGTSECIQKEVTVSSKSAIKNKCDLVDGVLVCTQR